MSRIRAALRSWDGSIIWHLFASQIWLVPGAISILFGLLAVGLMWSGPILDTNAAPPWWLFSGDARTARDLLGTILSGLITMTSLVLSMTFVVLTLAANQLGPRLVVILTDDRQIQSSLGLFVGSITYVLIVLRSIDDELGQNAVPHLSVTVASGLVLVCLLMLLFYVHKISRLIVSDTVIERIARDLNSGLEHALVDKPSEMTTASPPRITGRAVWIDIGKSGYIQTINFDELVDIARDCKGYIELAVRPGHFVLRQGSHMRITTPSKLERETIDRIRDQFSIGSERSPAQDLEFSIRQLVECATRALSPGAKDPFTVVAVIDKLSRALEILMGDRMLPSAHMSDDTGVVRVTADVTQIQEFIEIAFDQIRQGAAGSAFVLAHLSDTLGNLLAAIRRAEINDAICRHLDKLECTVKASITSQVDLQQCLARIAAARNKRHKSDADNCPRYLLAVADPRPEQ